MTNNVQPRVSRFRIAALAVFALLLLPLSAQAQQEPIRIGFGMALTGGLAAHGKTGMVAVRIPESDINPNGGLLHGIDRRARCQLLPRAGVDADMGMRHHSAWRAARPAPEVGVLRRPEHGH